MVCSARLPWWALWTVVMASVGAPTPGAAQEPPSDRTALSVAAALGLASPYGLGVIAESTVRHRRFVLRGRYASSGELAGDWLEDWGILGGGLVSPTSQHAQLSIAVGVGRAQYRHYGTLATTPDPAPSIGLLFDADGRVPFTRHIGVTVYVFGDLNSTRSFGGLAIGLWLGKL